MRSKATGERLRHFEEGLRLAMVRALPTRSRRDAEAFASLELRDMLVRFLAWESRLVHPHPRRVLRAQGLEQSRGFRDREADVRWLLGKIAAGIAVRPHLSDDVARGYVPRPAGRKVGPDLDLLLFDWGIHHLHLSHEVGANGFVKRGGDLLFAVFRPGTAYVLAVGGHGSWTDVGMVESAVRSWPSADLFGELKGMPSGRGVNPHERKTLRHAGVNSTVVIDGKAYVGSVSMGLSSACTPTIASLRASRILRVLRAVADDEAELRSWIMEQCRALGLDWPRRPKLTIVWTGGPRAHGLALHEKVTGVVLSLP